MPVKRRMLDKLYNIELGRSYKTQVFGKVRVVYLTREKAIVKLDDPVDPKFITYHPVHLNEIIS